MRLIVAATAKELSWLHFIDTKNANEYVPGTLIAAPKLRCDILITGTGIAATMFHLTRILLQNNYTIAVNLGIAGSYVEPVKPGMVVNVVADRFADFGKQLHNEFITAEKLPFTLGNKHPFVDGWLVTDKNLSPITNNLENVVAITSDTVHTSAPSVKRLKKIYNPMLESMEGAAFFYAAIMTNTPCVQIRCISNYVGPRSKGLWDIDLAVNNLGCFFMDNIHML